MTCYIIQHATTDEVDSKLVTRKKSPYKSKPRIIDPGSNFVNSSNRSMIIIENKELYIIIPH